MAIDNLGIPPLAGVCTYETAARPGLEVEQTVTRLKRFNYVARRLHETAAAHHPRTPEWEVKCALGLHLWLDAEHCTAIRARVAEMREPPLHLDEVPDERLRAALEELLRAQDTVELLAGIYGAVRPALVKAAREHIELLNPLFDHPTYRLLRGVLREQQEMVDWGERALAALTTASDTAARARAFAAHVERFLAAAGGIDGEQVLDADAALPPARWDGSDYVMDAEVRRDARFQDPFNFTMEPGGCYLDEQRPADERAFALAYQRLGEMDVPEWMAPIIFKTRGKPWAYYRDLARQLWDETRHAMMGEVAMHRVGVPFYAYPINQAASASLNREFTPLEAHLILWRIEQGLMPRKTGKRHEWTIAQLDGDPFYIALQDYDWADEVLHAQIGRRWLESEFPSPAARRVAAEEVFARWWEGLARYAAGKQSAWWPEFVERARSGRRARAAEVST
jgi:hypothetical protein